MKFVIRKVPERDTSILESILPNAIVYNDVRHEGCLTSFIRVLEEVDDDAVYIVDDMILAKNFKERAQAVIAERPNDVIVFSNFAYIDKTKKEGYYPADMMSWLLCTYIPKRIAKPYVEFMKNGAKGMPKKWFVREADDATFGCFLQRQLSEVVYLTVPNLAGHSANTSVVNPTREARLTENFDYANAAVEYRNDKVYQRTMEFVNKEIYHEKR